MSNHCKKSFDKTQSRVEKNVESKGFSINLTPRDALALSLSPQTEKKPGLFRETEIGSPKLRKKEVSNNFISTKPHNLKNLKSASDFIIFSHRQLALHRKISEKKTQDQPEDLKSKDRLYPNKIFESMMNKTDQVKESGKILHEQAKPISIENTQESEERDSKTNLLIELENENENLKNSLEKALSKIEELESQLKSKTNEKETFTNELKKKIEVLTDENFRLMKVVKDDERKAESKELKRVKIEIGPGNIERLNEKVLLQADTLFEKEVEIKMIRKQRDELFQSIKDLEETNKEAKILREHIFFLMNTFQQFKIKLLSLAKEFEVNSEDHQGMPIIEKFITSIKTLAKSMKTESRAFFQKRPDCLNGFFRDALTEKFKYSMKHFSDFKIEQEKFD